jgi:Ca2+-binding RTX toxin-like protein
MAVFVAADANIAVNMYQLFAFEPTFGKHTIDLIGTLFEGRAFAATLPPDPPVGFSVGYINTNITEPFVADGTTPVSGTYDKMDLWISGVMQWTLSGITPGLGNFAEINLPLQAFKVLLGNDTITGSDQGDTLFTGDGGTDSVDARGGNDVIDMAAAAYAPFHSINGGAGTDTINAISNHFSADKVLDLRNATLQSIEAFTIEGGLTVRLLGSQIGAGVASAAAISKLAGAGSASLEVVLNAPGATNLSGFTVAADLSITIFGSTGADEITGSGVGETISGDAGADTIRGGLGKDMMFGGAAGDRFDFDAVAEIGKKKGQLDLISDWGDSDRIDLSTIDANGSKKGDKAFKFLKKEGTALTKAGQVGFDQKKTVTYVQGDLNGDGKADFKLQVTGKIDFEKADFVL